jgi:hypothetical protein
MRFLGGKQQKKKARAKTKAIIQSLRLAGFAPGPSTLLRAERTPLITQKARFVR